MCRLSAFPPGFSRQEALDILMSFDTEYNNDGVGSAYVLDGEIKIDKWPKSLPSILAHNKPFLSHMPHNGWTIAHLRAASHGRKLIVNTHPFPVGPWAIIHNGVWMAHNVVKLALQGQVKFEGDTDTEVAAHLINKTGLKKFASEVDDGGVFMALNKDGSLQVAKTSGDLCFFPWKDKTLLSSELEPIRYLEAEEAHEGWYKFSPEGKLTRKFIKHIVYPSEQQIPQFIGGTEYYNVNNRNEYRELDCLRPIRPTEPMSRAQLERIIDGQMGSEEECERLDNMSDDDLDREIQRQQPTPHFHGFD